MNQDNESKFAPALPDDDNINKNVPTVPDSNDNTVKIYEGVAECIMNESDNLKNVKLRAKDLAQENVQKKIADYVNGFLKDRLLTFPDDEILSIANEIYKIIGVKYNMQDSDDNIVIHATVTAQIDSKDIMNYLIRFFKERVELKSQVESLRNENKALRVENDDLKRKIDELTPKVPNAHDVALATREFDAAYRLFYRTYYGEAIKRLNEAIELNPNYADAYKFRGMCYQELGEDEKAQADFRKANKISSYNFQHGLNF